MTRISIDPATCPWGRCQSRASAAQRLANRAATPQASEERTLSRLRSRRPQCQTGGRVSVKSTRSSMATSPPSDASMRRRLPLSRAIPIRGLPPAWWTITGRSQTVPPYAREVEIEDRCLSVCKNGRTSTVQVQSHPLDNGFRQGQPTGESGVHHHIRRTKDLVAASDFDRYPGLKTSGAIG